jgi:hypothetical protein
VTTAEFLERFGSVVGEGRMKLPTTLIEAWGQFVESCEAGYRDILDEFTFDRWVRHQIEKVLQDQGLREFDQMRWVEEQVREIDERYRTLLSDQILFPDWPWWEASFPRYAGPQMAADLLRMYGLTVEIREPPPAWP